MQWLRIFFILIFTSCLIGKEPSFSQKEIVSEFFDKESEPFSSEKDSENHSFDSEMHKVTESYETTLIKTIGTLIGLLSLVVLTVWILRKMGRTQFLNGGSLKSIKILGKRPLSPKSILYLIEVDKKQILIAESQVQVQPILSTNCFSENVEL